MNYNEIPANPVLHDFIRCFWESGPSAAGAQYTILPNGYFDLILEVKDNKIIKVKLTGIWTKAIDVKIEGNVGYTVSALNRLPANIYSIWILVHC